MWKYDEAIGTIKQIRKDGYVVVIWDNINGEWHYTSEQAKRLEVLNKQKITSNIISLILKEKIMAENKTYNLEDHTIAQIAKCLQVAILTGTDIADNLRQLQLEIKDDGKIGVTEAYLSIFNNNIEKLLNEVQAPITKDDEQLKLFE